VLTDIRSIIAVMLGRLYMMLGECENACLKLFKIIFQPKRNKFNKPMQTLNFLEAEGKFGSKVLEDAIKEVIKDQKEKNATTHFDQFTLGKYGQTFVDGNIIYNDPVQLVQRGAINIWPDREVLLSSIGRGSAPWKASQRESQEYCRRCEGYPNSDGKGGHRLLCRPP